VNAIDRACTHCKAAVGEHCRAVRKGRRVALAEFHAARIRPSLEQLGSVIAFAKSKGPALTQPTNRT